MKQILSQIQHSIKNKKGAVLILFAFVFVFILIFLIAIIEMIKIYTIYNNIDVQLSRLANNAVEENVSDYYRKDGYNVLTNVYELGNESTALSGDGVIAYFKDSFNTYTHSSNTPCEWTEWNPGAYGSGYWYGGSDGQFLYALEVESISVYPGVLEKNPDKEPSIEVSGTIYIANSIPGLLKTFVFQIPITVGGENQRIVIFEDVQVGGSTGVDN